MTLVDDITLRFIALGMADGQLQQADRHLLKYDRRRRAARSHAERLGTDHLPLALEHGLSALGWLRLAAELDVCR